MNGSNLVMTLLMLWAVVTAALILAAIYRSIVSMKREGQLFLDAGEAHLEAEQKMILKKLDRITPIVTWLGILSAILFLATGGLWLYQGFHATPYS